MALKKPGTKNATSTSNASASASNRRSADDQRRNARTLAKQQQASERIAGATVTLSQGLADATTARGQLNAAMEEIATGAEQAATAANQTLDAVNLINSQIKTQLTSADTNSAKIFSLQKLLEAVNGDVANLIDNVSSASNRQTESALMMEELEKQAVNINDAVKQVMRIADQTNLLALNAAIEAGRAGKHGKGFAVVADTVRTLAETSEANAGDITKLIEQIQQKANTVGKAVKTAAENAVKEADKGKAIIEQLDEIKVHMQAVTSSGDEVATGAKEMQVAVSDAQQGGEAISTASEEQSAAAEQVLKTLDEQDQALSGAEEASQELEIQSEELKNSTNISKSSEEVAAAAEELSTSIEEISRASSEIKTAIEQISKGSEQSASASEQASAGMEQIEKAAAIAETCATESLEKGDGALKIIVNNAAETTAMISGLSVAAEQGKAMLTDIQEIETISRRIDKITDAIATVSIKTGMLAVNGAIEAARAGEFGKGFAVVSGDIQSLADDAADNIEQIKELVKGIQDQSVLVMSDLASVSESSIAEVEKAKVTTSNLETVETDMAEVLEGNQSILKASQEIASAVDQSKKALEQVAAAAEQASSNTTEASAAAEQQAKGSEDLAAAIEEIASIADELQSV